jgi:hypothetical protein
MANDLPQNQPINDRTESTENVSKSDNSLVNMTNSDANKSIRDMQQSKGSNDIPWNNFSLTDSTRNQGATGESHSKMPTMSSDGIAKGSAAAADKHNKAGDSTIAASGGSAPGSGPSASGLKRTELSDSTKKGDGNSKDATGNGLHKEAHPGPSDSSLPPRTDGQKSTAAGDAAGAGKAAGSEAQKGSEPKGPGTKDSHAEPKPGAPDLHQNPATDGVKDSSAGQGAGSLKAVSGDAQKSGEPKVSDNQAPQSQARGSVDSVPTLHTEPHPQNPDQTVSPKTDSVGAMTKDVGADSSGPRSAVTTRSQHTEPHPGNADSAKTPSTDAANETQRNGAASFVSEVTATQTFNGFGKFQDSASASANDRNNSSGSDAVGKGPATSGLKSTTLSSAVSDAAAASASSRHGQGDNAPKQQPQQQQQFQPQFQQQPRRHFFGRRGN